MKYNLYIEIIILLFTRGLDFEKAYALYRLNRTDEAQQVLQSVENPEQRVKELLAQVVCIYLVVM